MHNGVKRGTGRGWRTPVSILIVLLAAAAVFYAAFHIGTRKNKGGQALSEAVEADAGIAPSEAGTTTDSAGNASVSVALPGLGKEKPEVDSSKEIVKDVLLSNVPKADYTFTFNGKLYDAAVVTRAGDEGGFNEGTYPEQTGDVLPLFTEGMEGDALYLDGTYGVELLGVEPLNESYTISFWFCAEELFDWSPFLLIGSCLLDEGGSRSFLSFNKKTTEEGEQVVPVFNTIDSALGNSCEVRPVIERKRCIDLHEWAYITICVDASPSSGAGEGRAMGYLYLNSELIGSAEVSRLNMDAEQMKAYVGINCSDILFRACYDEIHIWRQKLDESQISSMYTAYIAG